MTGPARRRHQDAHHRRPHPPRAAAGNLHRGGHRDGDRCKDLSVRGRCPAKDHVHRTADNVTFNEHFISIADCRPANCGTCWTSPPQLKKQHKETGRNDPILAGKTLAMIFEKPSLRTRVSFAVAMTHLGGAGAACSAMRKSASGFASRCRTSPACFRACATGSWPARSSTRKSSTWPSGRASRSSTA